jgi:hypothetical protein
MDIGINILNTVECYFIISIVAFLNSTVFSIANYFDKNKYCIFPNSATKEIIKY